MSDPSSTSADLSQRPLGDLTDQEIAQLTANLKEEQAKERPLLGEIEPLERLLEEYQEGTGYRMKVKKLIDDGWSGIRRSRGDGDCFYRGELLPSLSSQSCFRRIELTSFYIPIIQLSSSHS